MFKHILVPLDGSDLAESALPAAVYLSKIAGTAVTLIHVVEDRAPSEVHGERHLTGPPEAEEYLRSVVKRHFRRSARVSIHVHNAPVNGVARAITDHQTEFDHDLIIMCTHGKSGATTLVFGSIAQKIAALGSVPVLVVRPDSQHPGNGGFTATPMLVPLDGTEPNEASLPIARDLASKVHGEIQLLMVVPTPGTVPGKWEDSTKILPFSTERMLEMAADEAGEYLERIREATDTSDARVTTEVGRGDPARVIIENAARRGTRLLILVTHGTAGLGALWEGSVTGNLLSRVNIPALLIPLPRGEAPSGGAQ